MLLRWALPPAYAISCSYTFPNCDCIRFRPTLTSSSVSTPLYLKSIQPTCSLEAPPPSPIPPPSSLDPNRNSSTTASIRIVDSISATCQPIQAVAPTPKGTAAFCTFVVLSGVQHEGSNWLLVGPRWRGSGGGCRLER